MKVGDIVRRKGTKQRILIVSRGKRHGFWEVSYLSLGKDKKGIIKDDGNWEEVNDDSGG